MKRIRTKKCDVVEPQIFFLSFLAAEQGAGEKMSQTERQRDQLMQKLNLLYPANLSAHNHTEHTPLLHPSNNPSMSMHLFKSLKIRDYSGSFLSLTHPTMSPFLRNI